MGGKRFIPFREFLVDKRAVGIVLIACTIFFLTLSILPAPQLTAYLFTSLTSIGYIGVLAGVPAIGFWLLMKQSGALQVNMLNTGSSMQYVQGVR